MTRETSIEMGEGSIVITEEEKGGYWDTTRLTVPKCETVECSVIWKDDAIFELKPKYGDGGTLSIPLTVLLGLLSATVKTVRDDDSWWNGNEELRDQVAAALSLDLTPKVGPEVEAPKKRGRPSVHKTEEEKKAARRHYNKMYARRRRQKEEGTPVPITRHESQVPNR